MNEGGKDVEALLSNPRKAILHMAVPLFFTYLIARLQSFIDGVWCSGLGPDPLSAISISAPIYTIIISVGMALGVGASASIARYIGSGDKGRADRIASLSMVLTLLASVISMPIIYLAAEPIIQVSGGGYNVGISMDYIMPFIICILPLMFNGLLTGLFRGEGAAKKSTIVSVSASLINIVLDPIMIYSFDMGVVGAAWATCISFIVVTVAGFAWYLRGDSYITPHLEGVRFERVLLIDMAAISIPMIIEGVLSRLIIAPEQGLVVSCGGADGLVVYIYAFAYSDLAMIPVMAITAALIPVVSAQLGQGDPDKVMGSFRYSFKLATAIGILMGVLLFVFADQLVYLYTYSEDMSHLHDEMALALRIFSITPLINGLIRVCISMVQALRKALLSTVLMFSRELVFLSFYWFAARISMEAIYWSVDAVNVIMLAVAAAVVYAVLRTELPKIRKRDSEGGPEGGSAIS